MCCVFDKIENEKKSIRENYGYSGLHTVAFTYALQTAVAQLLCRKEHNP
jgi:hypothetical protein